VDLPTRSFDLARPGVAPPLPECRSIRRAYRKKGKGTCLNDSQRPCNLYPPLSPPTAAGSGGRAYAYAHAHRALCVSSTVNRIVLPVQRERSHVMIAGLPTVVPYLSADVMAITTSGHVRRVVALCSPCTSSLHSSCSLMVF